MNEQTSLPHEPVFQYWLFSFNKFLVIKNPNAKLTDTFGLLFGIGDQAYQLNIFSQMAVNPFGLKYNQND